MSYVLHGTTGTGAGDGILTGVASFLRDRGGSGNGIQPTAQVLGVASDRPDQLTQTFLDPNKRICVVLD